MTGIVASLGLPIIEVLPAEVKEAATGDPRATKGDVIAWAVQQTHSGHVDWPTSHRANKLRLTYEGKHLTLSAEHPADALAAIEAALRTDQFHLGGALSKPIFQSANEGQSNRGAIGGGLME